MKKICQLCQKNPATVHLTNVQNNVTKKLDICEACASKKGINISKPVPLTSVFAATQNAQAAKRKAATNQPKLICPQCRITWEEFRDTDRLGCPHDYEIFHKRLEPLLEDIHGATRHLGGAAAEADTQTAALRQLQEQMRQAAAAEDYNTAAKLRDQIRQLSASEQE